MNKHFETATIGAKAAQSIVEKTLEHGSMICMKMCPMLEYSFVGSEHGTNALHVIFEDGFSMPIPRYAGDTIARLVTIARLTWKEEVDQPNRLDSEYIESHRDSTGAVLGRYDTLRCELMQEVQKHNDAHKANEPYVGLPPNPSDCCEAHHQGWWARVDAHKQWLAMKNKPTPEMVRIQAEIEMIHNSVDNKQVLTYNTNI